MAQRHRTGGSTSSMLELLVPSEPDGGATRPRTRVSAPLLERLRGVGTEHVYADTADVQELEATLCPGPDRIVEEVDGSSVNQPLVQRVLTRHLEDSRFIGLARRFRTEAPSLTGADVSPYAYGALLGWIGTDVAHRVGGERAWEDYSLLGHADFEQAQEAIDDAIAQALAPASRDG